ncbi:transcription repressor NadR [Olsenella sp. Marseille-P4559]|uniref:transcription repressor NadR n=1 Tax=Olsenella sp. Marseille-P4559 TaxID=2364795 RepID=UPI00103209F3|nr:transcription repressor NadR [Olsenella sp. Marseille-P4559]
MGGEDRRAKIVALLDSAGEPISGGQLAGELGVSRQVIVQDIALLRRSGIEVESTHRGYVVRRSDVPRRIFKVRHSEEQIEDELNLIVDLGGTVEDVVVNHRTYGVISVSLNVSSRRDVARYLAEIASSRSTPLSRVTSGYHFHHVSAPTEEALDEIGAALAERGFLVDRLPYETVK